MTQQANGDTPWTPTEPDTGDAPWARPVAGAGGQTTPRARRYVENLPDWEPLPPGEAIVRRRRA